MIVLKTALLISLGVMSPAERHHLVQAQAIVESGVNQYAAGRAGERGAWQVIGRIWGRVPRSYPAQRAQHVKIMDTLVEECCGDVPTAIRRYNGSGRATWVYLGKVRRKTIELQILSV